jgi:hypothetical protein
MNHIYIKKLFKSGMTGNITILAVLILLTYSLISIYFANHFFFNTVINGVNVSLKSHNDVDNMIINYVKDYDLQLIERDGKTEEIKGQDIEMQYNKKNSISQIYRMQNSFKWISSLFNSQKYYVSDLYTYNIDYLKNKINELNCLNSVIISSQNVDFKYSNGSYQVIREVYGNEIIKDKLNESIEMSISKGETKLDLVEKLCYENPKYTAGSDKTIKTKNLLNKYVSATITYKFGSENETLDKNTINKWLSVDEDLAVVINKTAIMNYINKLSNKYDTIGIARNFKTSTGKTVEVKGGIYGWKINPDAEAKALFENITLGEVIEKEPIYTQRALFRNGDEIGHTYVEINITKQHVWFYKDGELITHGFVVTGNPNRGWSTVTGTYMLNYKQKGATLTGPDYESKVTYWMPFYGNIGLHDAPWRNSFGGEIYKRNGSHGCVNAPLYLAKTIFENIKEGAPVICYEEEQ